MRKPVRESHTPSSTRLSKQSQVKTPKKPKRPKPAKLVTTIKDNVGVWYLYNATDEQEYVCIYRYYHARFFLLVRRFNKNELAILFTTNIPLF